MSSPVTTVGVVRRFVPYTVLPLALLATCLASTPWLRAFPSSVLAVPLFGAALLSVLLPVFVVGIGVRRLWLSGLISLICFVFFTTLVALHEPAGFSDLWSGLVHGPAQVLSFALPLVSPRTLLVVPVALCWLGGSIVGECIGRGWHSVLPYATLLVTFGLSYAGTARAVTNLSDGRRYDTLLAGGLLVTLLLLRAAQAWVEQDQAAETTQPDGVLPLRGLAIGAVLSVAVALLAGAVVQSAAFAGKPRTPQRVPPIDRAQPLTPLSFVSGLRPADPDSKGSELFKLTVDRAASNYISLASVDLYDGDSWSFDRTFRPSGGVIPADTDPKLRSSGPAVSQEYRIDRGALTSSPWMPFLYRPQKIIGTAITIDAGSGMIVPSRSLHPGERYTVVSSAPTATFDQLGAKAQPASSPPPIDLSPPGNLTSALQSVITAFESETKTPATHPVQFLQAVVRDLRTHYRLSGTPGSSSSSAGRSPTGTGSSSPSGSPSSGPRSSSTSRSTSTSRSAGGSRSGRGSQSPPRFLAPSAAPSAHPASTPHSTSRPATSSPASSPSLSGTPASAPPSARTGGTSFADVLASILGENGRSATPEQYATLVALMSRQLHVPARVVTGFRIPTRGNATTIPAGTYSVSTADAWTWVEVAINGEGWVVLDPSPGAFSGPGPQPSAGGQPSQSNTQSPTNKVVVTASSSAVGAPKAEHGTPPTEHGLSLVVLGLIVLGGLFALAGLALLVPVLRKLRRAHRRRTVGDPRRRLVGAWQESLDVLIEYGLPELETLTSAEVAATTAERFGDEPGAQARLIGDAANTALFSPTSWIGSPEAEAAWRAEAVLRRTVRRRLGWRDRINAELRFHKMRRTRPPIGPASWAAAARERAAAVRSGPARRHRGLHRRAH